MRCQENLEVNSGGESVNWNPEDEEEPEGLTVQEVPAGNWCL